MARHGVRGPAVPEATSWFGAVGIEGALDEDAGHSRLDRGEWRPSDTPDSRFMSRQARRIVGSEASGWLRLYRAFVAARAALGVVLLSAAVLISAFGQRPQSDWVLLVCAGYAFAALALWMLPELIGGTPRPDSTRLRHRQWLATIGVDLAMFSLLHGLTGGGGLSSSALLVLPALMAGVLTPRLQALAVAAAGTMVLLLTAWNATSWESTLVLTQAGLAGSGLFLVALLANELAGRLAREERTARGSLEMARQQAQLNRLVLQEMQDGVLVVDRRGRVRAANPAARRLIGEPQVSRDESFNLTGVPAWEPLLRGVERAFAEGSWPEGGRDLNLPHAELPTPLRVRVRFTRRVGGRDAEDLCVLFLESLRSVQARVQQEKLAAMGRVSAGIAHEIRNPLAAILQANALLAEDAGTPQERQLTAMVAENAERLKRIVDDVMEVAPGRLSTPAPLDATAQVGAIAEDWARIVQLRLGPESPVELHLPAQPLGVLFEGEHLRRVLVNLLDNALRHGSSTPGAVQLSLVPAEDGRARLSVASDGARIEPDTERYLFEPFFSTRSRGTGLGLYICRELCERYGASIDYRAHGSGVRHVNEFTVMMRRAAPPTGAAPSPEGP